MAIIKRFGVLSVGKIYALLLAVVGLLEGIMIAVAQATGTILTDSSYPFLALGYYSIIVMPLVYAAFGFVVGVLGVLLYNGFANLVGGIEVDLETGSSKSSVSVSNVPVEKKAKK